MDTSFGQYKIYLSTIILYKCTNIMLISRQIKAARSLLGWSQNDLAKRTDLKVPTIKRMESGDGPIKGITTNVWNVQKALEDGGVRFIDADEKDGPGVRLKKA
jgi:transcriptional regulator with XRE-family HTH domain